MRATGIGQFQLSRVANVTWAILILGMTIAGPAAAQSRCDASLRPAGGGDGYKLRGDRCEGIYTRAVALGDVRLVGVHWRSGRPPDLQAGRALRLEWATAPTGKQVGVRALALRRRLFYRMDSVRPAGASGYDWPSEVLVRLRLAPADLGIIASSPLRLQGSIREILLPVSVGRELADPGQVELLLLPEVQLKEVYLTIFPVGSDGRVGPPHLKDMPVRRGYYPADKGISVILPSLLRAGLYRVDIGSSFTTGGAAASSQLIYIAKPSG